MVRFITNVNKDYPTMSKIIIYKEPSSFFSCEYHGTRRKSDQITNDFQAATRSLTRTKTMIKDICACNSFDLFCTFTFDPKKVDRYNIAGCCGIMTRWLFRQRDNHSPELKYLVIPELHKDGAIHFHALLANYNGSLKDSKIVQNGRKVYNLTRYRFGFSTAVKIDSMPAVANYVTKYVTKDMLKVFNKHRYFVSRNIRRPIKTVNDSRFRDVLPLFKKKVYEDDFKQVFVYNDVSSESASASL